MNCLGMMRENHYAPSPLEQMSPEISPELYLTPRVIRSIPLKECQLCHQEKGDDNHNLNFDTARKIGSIAKTGIT